MSGSICSVILSDNSSWIKSHNSLFPIILTINGPTLTRFVNLEHL